MFLAQAIPSLDQVIATLLQQGVLGIACLALGYAYIRKDSALQESHKARVDDAKKFGEILAEHSKATAINTQTLSGLTTLIQNLPLTSRVKS